MLPYMADERHAPDALFSVAEGDFRLLARHSACQPAAGACVAEASYAALSTAWASRVPSLVKELNEPVVLSFDELNEWCYDNPPISANPAELSSPPATGADSWSMAGASMLGLTGQ